MEKKTRLPVRRRDYSKCTFVLQIGDPMPDGWQLLSRVPGWRQHRSVLTHWAREGKIRMSRVAGDKGQLILRTEEVEAALAAYILAAEQRNAKPAAPEASDRQLSLLPADTSVRCLEAIERVIVSMDRVSAASDRLYAALDLLIGRESEASAASAASIDA
jgi:hypothetical protein